MQKHRLGSTDIEVSAIGLGTVKFGRNQGVRFPTAFELPEDHEIEALLAQAQLLGINLLDTAPAYGTSEERLGQLLQGKRHQWIISTKAGEEFIDGKSHFDFSSTAIKKSVERSLKRLRTDYLDVVLAHSNGDDERIIKEENIFETLSQLKREGKIRAYGMSTKTVTGGLLTIDYADVVMMTYHPDYLNEQEILEYAHQKQKGVFIKKALASGHLKRSVNEVMQFIFAQPGVTSVVVGTLNPEHLRENAHSGNLLVIARPRSLWPKQSHRP